MGMSWASYVGCAHTRFLQLSFGSEWAFEGYRITVVVEGCCLVRLLRTHLRKRSRWIVFGIFFSVGLFLTLKVGFWRDAASPHSWNHIRTLPSRYLRPSRCSLADCIAQERVTGESDLLRACLALHHGGVLPSLVAGSRGEWTGLSDITSAALSSVWNSDATLRQQSWQYVAPLLCRKQDMPPEQRVLSAAQQRDIRALGDAWSRSAPQPTGKNTSALSNGGHPRVDVVEESLPAARTCRGLPQHDSKSAAHLWDRVDTSVLRVVMVAPDLNMIVCTIPKAGCGTLRKHLLFARGMWWTDPTASKAETLREELLHGKPCAPGECAEGQHTRFHQNSVLNTMSMEEFGAALADRNQFRRVTITRNPWSRFMSFYLDKVESGSYEFVSRNKEHRAWLRECQNPAVRKDSVTPRIQSTRVDDWSLSNPFPAITDATGPTLRMCLARRAADVMFHLWVRFSHGDSSVTFNSHWMPQTQLCRMHELCYDTIGDIAQMTDVESALFAAIPNKRALAIADERVLNTTRAKYGTGANAKVQKFLEQLGEPWRTRLFEVYRDDFESLGYNPSWEEV